MDRNFQIDELLIVESLKQEVIDKYPQNRIKEAIMQSIDRERNILQNISDFFMYRKSQNNLIITSILTICIILTSLIFTLTPMKSFAAENIEKLMYWVISWDRNGDINLVQKPAEEVENGRISIAFETTELSDEEISNLLGYSVRFPNEISNGHNYILTDRSIAVNQNSGVQIPYATYFDDTIDSEVFVEITRKGWGYKDNEIIAFNRNSISFHLKELKSILYPTEQQKGRFSKADKTKKPEIINTSQVEWEIDGVYYHLLQNDRDNYVLSNDEMIALAEDFASK